MAKATKPVPTVTVSDLKVSKNEVSNVDVLNAVNSNTEALKELTKAVAEMKEEHKKWVKAGKF